MDEQQTKLAEELLFSTVKQPSFAKQLYFGVFDPTHTLPFPEVTEQERITSQSIQTTLSQIAENEIDPDWIDRNATIPDSVIQSLSKLGILGMTVPKEYGGLGMTQTSFCHAIELLAARCASTALFVNVHQSIGLRALLIFGTPAQKERWLKPLAHGELFAAFSLTEPNAGSDASAIETRAIYDPSRQIYRITGKKQWTTNGGIADVLTVMARTEIDTPQGKQDKITAFLVTPDMPGFKVTNPALEKVGMRGTKTANLAFDNMEVPAENILGPIGGGLRVCLTVLDYGRTAFGATCTGAAKYLVKRAIEHARSRYQFKRPLASFGLVKQKIANMSAYAYAMESTTYLTAGLIDAGVDDIMLEAAILKVFASDSVWTILYDTMQIYGGRSFFTDQPFERMMRDARLNMIGEGSNEVMRAFIGAVGMRDVGIELKTIVDQLKSPPKFIEALWGYAQRSYRRWNASKPPVRSPELQAEAAQLSRAIRRFGIAVVRSLAKHKEQVLEQQLLLDRLATSAMSIYTMTAVLSRLDRDLSQAKGKPELIGNDLEIGKFYCQLALKKIDESLSNLFDSHDRRVESLSDKLTAK